MSGTGNKGALPGWIVALWTAALILLVGGLVAARHLPGEGFTALIQFDERFTPRALPALRETPHHTRPTGYDGQFYAQLALDPFLSDPAALQTALDGPAYRARRVLLPALAHGLGGGNVARTLDAYALLNPLFWLGFLALLLRACRPLSLPAMAAVTATALAGGALESVRLALTDLPAAALLLGAALLISNPERLRPLWAGAVAALAGLARDTAAAGAGLLLLPIPPTGRTPFGKRLAGLALGTVPVILWALWVRHAFDGMYAQNGGAGDNFGFPLAAACERIAGAFRQLAAGAPLFGQEGFTVWIVIGLHVQAVWLLRQLRPNDPLWRMALPFALMVWVLGPAVWGSALAAARALLPMTVAFNLMLLPELRAGKGWGWFAAGNFFSVFGVVKFATYVS